MDTESGECLSATQQFKECGKNTDWEKTIEASNLSAVLDGTMRQNRREMEASDLHKARVASLTPDPATPDLSSAGSSDNEHDTTLKYEEREVQRREVTEAFVEAVYDFRIEDQATTDGQMRCTTTQLDTLASEVGTCEREMSFEKTRCDAEIQNIRDACDDEVTNMQDNYNSMGLEVETLRTKTKQLREDGKKACSYYLREHQKVRDQDKVISNKIEVAEALHKRALLAEQKTKDVKEEMDQLKAKMAKQQAHTIQSHDGTAAEISPHSRPQVTSKQTESKYWFAEQRKRDELISHQKGLAEGRAC
jgi:hypothetical protein